jgi:hypothetical protein
MSRFELKYSFDSRWDNWVRDRLAFCAAPTDRASYEVNTLYFDDSQRSSYRRKLDGEALRSKQRLRFYGDPARPETPVRWEVKARHWQTNEKRQTWLTAEQARGYMAGDKNVGQPFVWVQYRREEFQGLGCRITLDTELRFKDFAGLRDKAIRRSVCEVKCETKPDFHVLSWLTQVATLGPFSKYGLAMEALGYGDPE